MKTKINDLKSVIREFSILSQELLLENNRLNSELEKSDIIIAEEKERLTKAKKDHEREVYGLNQRIQDMKGDKDRIEQEKKELELKYEAVTSAKEKVKKKKEALIEENDSLKEKIRILEIQLNESNKLIEKKLTEILKKIISDDSIVIDCINSINSMKDVLNDYKVNLSSEDNTEKSEAEQSNDNTEDENDKYEEGNTYIENEQNEVEVNYELTPAEPGAML